MNGKRWLQSYPLRLNSRTRMRACLIQINLTAEKPGAPFTMTRIDWTHTLSIAATLALAFSAISILLFAV